MTRMELAAATVQFSIVVPTCNRVDLLKRCLNALAAALQRVEGPRVEVIVSDDSRDDATREMVVGGYPWVTWVRGPRRGPAANRNTGVANARGSWILFTDDDCIPDIDWMRAWAAAIQDKPHFQVFEGKTVADRARARFDEESPVNTEGGYLWSCNMAIRRELFDRLGGFSESFPHATMEDIDFRLRLLASGERFAFVAEAIVCHPYRTTKGISFVVKSGESYLHLVSRHPQLLGERRWRDCALNFARRARILLRAAREYRFRGFGYGLAWLAVCSYFDLRLRARFPPSSLSTQPSPPA